MKSTQNAIQKHRVPTKKPELSPIERPLFASSCLLFLRQFLLDAYYCYNSSPAGDKWNVPYYISTIWTHSWVDVAQNSGIRFHFFSLTSISTTRKVWGYSAAVFLIGCRRIWKSEGKTFYLYIGKEIKGTWQSPLDYDIENFPMT